MSIASIYCVLAGLFLAAGWEDPLAKVSPNSVAHAAEVRRGGIFVLAVRFWPYVLMGLGGFCAFNSISILRAMFKK